MPDNGRNSTIWPIPLSQIEEIVSAHFGPGRVRGNAAAPCLSRQVSMYLAKHVGGWSLPKIGRFYNGRHHTTVLHAVAKIETLRKTDAAFDSLLDILTAALASKGKRYGTDESVSSAHSELIDAVALRVIQRLKEFPMSGETKIQAAAITMAGSAARRTVTGGPEAYPPELTDTLPGDFRNRALRRYQALPDGQPGPV